MKTDLPAFSDDSAVAAYATVIPRRNVNDMIVVLSMPSATMTLVLVDNVLVPADDVGEDSVRMTTHSSSLSTPYRYFVAVPGAGTNDDASVYALPSSPGEYFIDE